MSIMRSKKSQAFFTVSALAMTGVLANPAMVPHPANVSKMAIPSPVPEKVFRIKIIWTAKQLSYLMVPKQIFAISAFFMAITTISFKLAIMSP